MLSMRTASIDQLTRLLWQKQTNKKKKKQTKYKADYTKCFVQERCDLPAENEIPASTPNCNCISLQSVGVIVHNDLLAFAIWGHKCCFSVFFHFICDNVINFPVAWCMTIQICRRYLTFKVFLHIYIFPPFFSTENIIFS